MYLFSFLKFEHVDLKKNFLKYLHTCSGMQGEFETG